MAAGLKVEGMKALFKQGLLTRATHIGLLTNETTEFNTTNSADYARVALTKANWTISNGVATYGAAIEFDAETPSGWQTASWIALYDGSGSTANVLFTANITDVTIAASRRVYIAANALTIDLDVANSDLTNAGAEDAFNDGLFSNAVHIGFLDSADAEITGTGYARAQVNASVMAVDGTTGVASNNAVIASPAAGSNWGNPDAVGIYDASTAGNLLAQRDFTTDIGAPNTGQKISFAASSLTFDLGVAA